MRFGIHWEIIPEKALELMKLFMEGKVVVPDGLKIVEEYIWGNKSLEIVETDNMGLIMNYVTQLTPYVRNFKVTALMTLKELLPKPPG